MFKIAKASQSMHKFQAELKTEVIRLLSLKWDNAKAQISLADDFFSKQRDNHTDHCLISTGGDRCTCIVRDMMVIQLGIKNLENESGWHRWDPMDDDKDEYMVRLETGEIVPCWPNAGFMNALDQTGRSFVPLQVDVIRKGVVEFMGD